MQRLYPPSPERSKPARPRLGSWSYPARRPPKVHFHAGPRRNSRRCSIRVASPYRSWSRRTATGYGNLSRNSSCPVRERRICSKTECLPTPSAETPLPRRDRRRRPAFLWGESSYRGPSRREGRPAPSRLARTIASQSRVRLRISFNVQMPIATQKAKKNAPIRATKIPIRVAIVLDSSASIQFSCQSARRIKDNVRSGGAFRNIPDSGVRGL